jgi:hypothetical protein
MPTSGREAAPHPDSSPPAPHLHHFEWNLYSLIPPWSCNRLRPRLYHADARSHRLFPCPSRPSYTCFLRTGLKLAIRALWTPESKKKYFDFLVISLRRLPLYLRRLKMTKYFSNRSSLDILRILSRDPRRLPRIAGMEAADETRPDGGHEFHGAERRNIRPPAGADDHPCHSNTETRPSTHKYHDFIVWCFFGNE